MIDTLAGEWPARTNYLYLTYRADADDVRPMPEGSVLVDRGRPVPDRLERRVRLVDHEPGRRAQARRASPASRVLNSNPETVSTDYDRSDRLYFEEITLERVRDIADFEALRGASSRASGASSPRT